MTLLDRLRNGFVSTPSSNIDQNLQNPGIIDALKKDYGLAPRAWENTEIFLKRAYESIHNPRSENEQTIKKFKEGNCTEITHEVKAVVEYYLGIKNPLITAFSSEKLEHRGGCAVRETDGSTTIFMSSEYKVDNSRQIVSRLVMDLQTILDGKTPEIITISTETENSVSKMDSIISNNLSSDDPVNIMYMNFINQAINNRTYVLLHESIHGLHFNNILYHAAAPKEKSIPRILLENFTHPISRTSMMQVSLESECLAFKLGLDMFSDDIIQKAAVQAKFKGIELDEYAIKSLQEEFHDRNTNITKAVLEKGYIKGEYKIRDATDTYAGGLINTMYGSMLVCANNIAANILGTVMMTRGVIKMLSIPVHPYFIQRLQQNLETLETLSEKYGNARNAFYETLGMNYQEMRQVAQNHCIQNHRI